MLLKRILLISVCIFYWNVEHFVFLFTITFPYRLGHCSQPVQAKILTYTEVINSKHIVGTLKSLYPEPDLTTISQKVSPEPNSIPFSWVKKVQNYFCVFCKQRLKKKIPKSWKFFFLMSDHYCPPPPTKNSGSAPGLH